MCSFDAGLNFFGDDLDPGAQSSSHPVGRMRHVYSRCYVAAHHVGDVCPFDECVHVCYKVACSLVPSCVGVVQDVGVVDFAYCAESVVGCELLVYLGQCNVGCSSETLS